MVQPIIKVARVSMNIDRLGRARRRCEDRGLFKASAFMRTTARRSIKKRRRPSPPGSPPSTQTRRLRNAIQFHVYRGEGRAVIGPTAQRVGEAGAAHEHGEKFRGDDYPPRPFMGPAEEITRPVFAGFFAREFK